ncbi:MAG: ATP-binding cassette domain-containing protein [Clostridia bacterium]|nr:ATP-binding cassette domain-containing protein [Clostridia bacterium]
MLELQGVHKTFNIGTVNEKKALVDLNLKINDGDFITVIGGNGAGKSTMLNIIAGVFTPEEGKITIDGVGVKKKKSAKKSSSVKGNADENEVDSAENNVVENQEDNSTVLDITKMPEYKRASMIGRVFQDPMVGTAANMSIEENLALANRRGKTRGLRWNIKKEEREYFREKLKMLDLNLEDRLTTKVGLLSGGQRQALTLLMASLIKPKVLLLDEHTAALDPKTASKVLSLTEEITSKDKITTVMITHNMKDAITYGNRLIMMMNGSIIYDVSGEEKKNLTVKDLLLKFEQNSDDEFANDRMLLS